MATFVAWIDDSEPVTAEELVAHARLGSDEATALDAYIKSIVIPAARQVAEVRSGAAIRRARYVERREGWPPHGDLQLGKGQVYAIESITADGQALDAASYSLWVVDKDPRVRLAAARSPYGVIEVTYLAGIETISNFPSVKNWILLAATWMLEQPSMFTLEQAVQTMPGSYIDSLLAPISIEGRV